MARELFTKPEVFTGFAELQAFKDVHLRFVIGADEAGRGCLAGPLHAAAVALPPGLSVPGVTDSKRLSAGARARALGTIEALNLPRALRTVSPQTIDEINILQASLLGMEGAAGEVLDGLLATHPDLQPAQVLLLVDGNQPLRNWQRCPQRTLVQGDFLSLAIACASIVAKVSRDAAMEALHQDFPGYHWDRNKGYPSAEHLDALAALGPSLHHRLSYGPCKK